MFIIFDIGGTKTRITSALSTDNFNNPVIFDTPLNYSEGIELLKQHIHSLVGGQPITAIVGGIAGPWNNHDGLLLSSHNLSDWVQKPLRSDLENTFHTRVIIDNDAAMVGLGEAVFGAGKDFSIVAYITISTGVGGVRIVNGAIDDRSIGFEPGKQIIDAEGHTLEDLISGKSLEESTGQKPATITDAAVWDGLAKNLAFGINNIVVDWSPDVVVLGGSMMNKVGIPIDATEKYLHEVLKVFPVIPPLKKALLGDIGGLYGGLARLRENS